MMQKPWWIRGKGLERSEGAPRLLVLIAALSMMLGAAPAVFAAGANQTDDWPTEPEDSAVSPDVVGPHKVPYSANFHLTYTYTPSVCPDFYANQCAALPCGCLTFTGQGAGNRFGKAPAPQVYGEVTIDWGNATQDPDGACFPTFGYIDVPGTKEFETLKFTGASCQGFGTGLLNKFYGGWEFATFGATTYDGVGQANGKFGDGTLNLSFHGQARTN